MLSPASPELTDNPADSLSQLHELIDHITSTARFCNGGDLERRDEERLTPITELPTPITACMQKAFRPDGFAVWAAALRQRKSRTSLRGQMRLLSLPGEA